MQVEIVYALPQEQTVVTLELTEGATVADALAAVAQRSPFSRLDLTRVPVGVYGERVSREQRLIEHDRVEIYRPLAVDPVTARRARAQGSKG